MSSDLPLQKLHKTLTSRKGYHWASLVVQIYRDLNVADTEGFSLGTRSKAGDEFAMARVVHGSSTRAEFDVQVVGNTLQVTKCVRQARITPDRFDAYLAFSTQHAEKILREAAQELAPRPAITKKIADNVLGGLCESANIVLEFVLKHGAGSNLQDIAISEERHVPVYWLEDTSGFLNRGVLMHSIKPRFEGRLHIWGRVITGRCQTRTEVDAIEKVGRRSLGMYLAESKDLLDYWQLTPDDVETEVTTLADWPPAGEAT